jgi:hypothetical protein
VLCRAARSYSLRIAVWRVGQRKGERDQRALRSFLGTQNSYRRLMFIYRWYSGTEMWCWVTKTAGVGGLSSVCRLLLLKDGLAKEAMPEASGQVRQMSIV